MPLHTKSTATRAIPVKRKRGRPCREYSKETLPNSGYRPQRPRRPSISGPNQDGRTHLASWQYHRQPSNIDKKLNVLKINWKCLPRLLWRAEIECIKTFTLARALDNHPPRSVLLRQRQFGSNLTSKTILSALTLMPATERNNNDLATWFGYRFSKPAGQRRARHVERDLFCRSSKMQHMTVVVVLFQKLQNMLYQKGTSSSSRPLLLETNGIACIRTILFIIIKWDAEHR